MMQQQLALAYRREQLERAGEARRQPGREDRIFEIDAPDEIVERREPVEIHRSRHLIMIDFLQRKLAKQELSHVIGTILGGLEPYRGTVAPLRELTFERAT